MEEQTPPANSEEPPKKKFYVDIKAVLKFRKLEVEEASEADFDAKIGSYEYDDVGGDIIEKAGRRLDSPDDLSFEVSEA